LQLLKHQPDQPDPACVVIAAVKNLIDFMNAILAIPLLAITGVKARSILPYTFIIMLVGGMSMAVFLMLF
jgi:short subunit fatty acids transporter